MLLPIHRRYVVTDAESTGKNYGLQQLGEVLARKVQKDNSDISGSYEVKAAAISLVRSLDPI